MALDRVFSLARLTLITIFCCGQNKVGSARQHGSSISSSVQRHSASARSRPNEATASSYGAAVPRSAKPPFRPLAPSATRLSSTTRTRSPASASASAQAQPVTPAPTIPTST